MHFTFYVLRFEKCIFEAKIRWKKCGDTPNIRWKNDVNSVKSRWKNNNEKLSIRKINVFLQYGTGQESLHGEEASREIWRETLYQVWRLQHRSRGRPADVTHLYAVPARLGAGRNCAGADRRRCRQRIGSGNLRLNKTHSNSENGGRV